MLYKYAFQHKNGDRKMLKSAIFICHLFKYSLLYITFAK